MLLLLMYSFRPSRSIHIIFSKSSAYFLTANAGFQVGPRNITDHPYLSHERFEQVLKVRAYGIGMGAKKWN